MSSSDNQTDEKTEMMPSPASKPTASRGLSAIEVLIGAGIVIGHNVFRMLPNEVPILVFLGLISIGLRDGRWSAMGFRRPSSWKRVILIAVAAAALRIILGEFVVEPLTGMFWPAPIPPTGANDIKGNPINALIALAIVWGFAAFGEEIGYRGYLMNRAADVGRRSTAAYWIGIIIVSLLFGFGHYYKGASGIVDSGVAGLILGVAYLAAGRNLWACILAHGFIDTFAVMVAFLGWG